MEKSKEVSDDHQNLTLTKTKFAEAVNLLGESNSASFGNFYMKSAEVASLQTNEDDLRLEVTSQVYFVQFSVNLSTDTEASMRYREA